jgi:hypothetical protein
MAGRWQAWTLVFALLTGCEDPARTALVAPPAAGTAAPVAQPAAATAPRIGGVKVNSRAVIGSEQFEVRFKMEGVGSGTLASYGLKTRLGEKVFKIDKPFQVIAGGEVQLNPVGPLPNQTEAGDFDVEFWVVDNAGMESNRQGFKLLVQ